MNNLVTISTTYTKHVGQCCRSRGCSFEPRFQYCVEKTKRAFKSSINTTLNHTTRRNFSLNVSKWLRLCFVEENLLKENMLKIGSLPRFHAHLCHSYLQIIARETKCWITHLLWSLSIFYESLAKKHLQKYFWPEKVEKTFCKGVKPPGLIIYPS